MNGGEGLGEALVERTLALRHDVEPGWQPAARLAVEDQEPSPGRGHQHDVERVGERGFGERGGLLVGERRHEARLDPAGHRLLRDDEQGGIRPLRRGGHRVSTPLMS